MDILIREMQESEYPLLEDFLYKAIFVPENVAPPPRSIVKNPELQVYIAHFGTQPWDIALAAEMEHTVIGAVWVRIMNDYGHIDDQTPSLAISVYEEFRGHGIGTALMINMLMILKNRGCQKVSLAVQKANDAVKMYHSVGFEIVAEKEEEYLMVKHLQ